MDSGNGDSSRAHIAAAPQPCPTLSTENTSFPMELANSLKSWRPCPECMNFLMLRAVHKTLAGSFPTTDAVHQDLGLRLVSHHSACVLPSRLLCCFPGARPCALSTVRFLPPAFLLWSESHFEQTGISVTRISLSSDSIYLRRSNSKTHAFHDLP